MVAKTKSVHAANSTVAGQFKEAVVVLRPPAGGAPPTPDDTRRAAELVLGRARQQTGVSPEATTVLEQMHAFSVRAPQAFLDALSESSEVDQVLGERNESAYIPPVGKRSVILPD